MEIFLGVVWLSIDDDIGGWEELLCIVSPLYRNLITKKFPLFNL
jgi:hypothetical protein